MIIIIIMIIINNNNNNNTQQQTIDSVDQKYALVGSILAEIFAGCWDPCLGLTVISLCFS